ncbi:hypothetical protein Rhal01_03017 [Rubritalea halochordaticola]|uniref:Uncharacterized protein n=1 Tax=Rubritalea halochordaticola TaxID=714537 RepID=A0ABP9V2I8_9BACT
MHLLETFEDQAEAEKGLAKLSGKKMLTSDRDDNVVVYKLFGEPSWVNFYNLEMYDLPELKRLLDTRQSGGEYEDRRHKEIVESLNHVASAYSLSIPKHWLPEY